MEESQRLLEATWRGDAETVAGILEYAHEEAGTAGYHSEAAFSYAVQLAYFNARNYYTKVLELSAGKGYADLVYLPAPDHSDKPALLVELKYNHTADAAIEQIHRQNCPHILKNYKGNLLLVGIAYDRNIPNSNADFKHHTCVIERA